MEKKEYLNKFLVGDCEEVMKNFPDESIDFVITSPPYTNQRSYNGSDQGKILPDDYNDWFIPKAKEIYRVLKPTGSFILNINDKTVDKFQHLYVFKLVIRLADEVGFHLVRDYIWFNPATPPNSFSKGTLGRTKKSHEYCFWFSKSDEWTFNMDAIRRPYSDAMKIYLKGQGKGDREHNTRPSTYSFDCEKVWTDKGGADPGSVIDLKSAVKLFLKDCEENPGDVLPISNTGSKNSYKQLYEEGIKHPARFPERLVEFFIKAGTRETEIVLDPFMGSGTTAAVAERLGRNWVGIELSKDYVKLSKLRLKIERENLLNNKK